VGYRLELGGPALEIRLETGPRGDPLVDQLDRDEVLAARALRKVVLRLVDGAEATAADPPAQPIAAVR
jgi:hypothetical protein